jgi:hypothetical protein
VKKRLICGALLLALIIPSSGLAFSDDAAITQKDAVKTCTDLGIINGRDNGNFDPADSLSRAEMAKMIALIRVGGQVQFAFGGDSNPFADIEQHWAKGYILYCYAGKQVEGRSATSYAPNETLTAAECAKMLLTLLGYRSDVEGYTGSSWESAVWTRAEQVGLLQNLETVKSADIISRENASVMIANALQAKTVSYEGELIQVGSNAITCNYTLKEGSNTLQENYFK